MSSNGRRKEITWTHKELRISTPYVWLGVTSSLTTGRCFHLTFTEEISFDLNSRIFLSKMVIDSSLKVKFWSRNNKSHWITWEPPWWYFLNIKIWNTGWKPDTHCGKSNWYATLPIPFTNLERTNTQWGQLSLLPQSHHTLHGRNLH